MRFHMHVLPTYFPDLDPPFEVFYQQILDQIALAEELGWECFWFTEHHFNLYGGPEPNPAVFLSAAAARTSRIHLGSAISVLPLHHPIQVAEDYAMVDVMSGGRLGFNIMTTAHPYPPDHYTEPLNAWRDGLREGRLSPADRHCKVHLRVWVDESAERAKEVAEAALIRYDDISAISRGGTFDPS